MVAFIKHKIKHDIIYISTRKCQKCRLDHGNTANSENGTGEKKWEARNLHDTHQCKSCNTSIITFFHGSWLSHQSHIIFNVVGVQLDVFLFNLY